MNIVSRNIRKAVAVAVVTLGSLLLFTGAANAQVKNPPVEVTTECYTVLVTKRGAIIYVAWPDGIVTAHGPNAWEYAQGRSILKKRTRYLECETPIDPGMVSGRSVKAAYLWGAFLAFLALLAVLFGVERFSKSRNQRKEDQRKEDQRKEDQSKQERRKRDERVERFEQGGPFLPIPASNPPDTNTEHPQ